MAETPSQQEPSDSASLTPEVLVRRVALISVPLLLALAYVLRSESPEAARDQAPAADSSGIPHALVSNAAAKPHDHAVSAKAPPLPPASELSLYGEGAVPSSASSKPAPALSELPAIPRGIAAVDLPEANLGVQRLPNTLSGRTAPCGGLFVRLITDAEDESDAFASMAKGFAEPAEIVRIGDTIGGFRVTGIEWDRVWVQSDGKRCAVGMHFGARGAQEQAEQGLSAEQYASLPWVLPHSIVSGLSKRSEMEFELDATAIAALFARGADVFAGIRVKLLRANGDSSGGLELFDIPLDSLLERLGIEPGDILVSIGDQHVASVQDVVQALEAARQADGLVANFTRKAEPFSLTLKVRTTTER